MSNSIDRSTSSTSIDDDLALDRDFALPSFDALPEPEIFATLAATVLKPWALESEEINLDQLRDIIQVELDFLQKSSNGDVAWAAAQFVVSREQEIMENGDTTHMEGLEIVTKLVFMYEQIFRGTGGNSLVGSSV